MCSSSKEVLKCASLKTVDLKQNIFFLFCFVERSRQRKGMCRGLENVFVSVCLQNIDALFFEQMVCTGEHQM